MRSKNETKFHGNIHALYGYTFFGDSREISWFMAYICLLHLLNLVAFAQQISDASEPMQYRINSALLILKYKVAVLSLM